MNLFHSTRRHTVPSVVDHSASVFYWALEAMASGLISSLKRETVNKPGGQVEVAYAADYDFDGFGGACQKAAVLSRGRATPTPSGFFIRTQLRQAISDEASYAPRTTHKWLDIQTACTWLKTAAAHHDSVTYPGTAFGPGDILHGIAEMLQVYNPNIFAVLINTPEDDGAKEYIVDVMCTNTMPEMRDMGLTIQIALPA